MNKPTKRRYTNRWRLMVAAGVALLSLTGCGSRKTESVGGARDILVFTPYKNTIKQELALGLEKEVFTPQPASEFFLKYMRLDELEPRLEYHAMLFLGLEDDPWVSEIFPAEVTAQDSSAMYRIRDVWARDQLILLLVAKDSASLVQGLKTRRQEIYEAFKYHMLARLEAMTYLGGEEKEHSARMRDYGFRLRVPSDWILVEQDSAGNFIWVHNHNPDRSVFIYWENSPRAGLNAQMAMDIRDSVTGLYYEGDLLNRQFTTAGPSYFRGLESVKISGIWENEEIIPGGGGGPMISFAFNTDDRFYLIDGMLYYPEATPSKKMLWLSQLEVILASFQHGTEG